MKRRALLATAGSGLAAALAGCSGSGDDSTLGRHTPRNRTRTTTFDGTPAGDLTRRDRPEPPADPTPDTATDFVRRYERAVLYNDLVDEAPGGDRPVRTEVSAVETSVLADLDDAVLVASDGSARLQREDGGYTRNRALVVHHVGDGSHRPRPYNAYRCASPGLGDDADAVEDAAGFQLYDFSGEDPDVSVAVRDADTGDQVFFSRYAFDGPSLVVQPDVVATAGRYDVSVATQPGSVASLAWDAAPGTPSWLGLTAFVLPGGDLYAAVLDPDLSAEFGSTLCARTY